MTLLIVVRNIQNLYKELFSTNVSTSVKCEQSQKPKNKYSTGCWLHHHMLTAMIQTYLLIYVKSLPYLMVFLPMIGDPLSYPGCFPFSSQDLLCNCRTSLSTSSSTGWYFERLSLSWSSRFLFLFQHFLHQRQTIIHSINSMMVEIEMITVRPTEPSIPENKQI